MGRTITVSREFGSGGRELGKRLAEVLGFDYYDREIVAALSSETGMNENYLENELESGGLFSIPIHFAQTFARFPAVSDQTVQIMQMQTKLIKRLAEKGNCVIVGRAADTILEDYRPFKLFVYADQASRLARCRERAPADEHMSDKELLREMKRIDKTRAECHDIIAPYTWGDKGGYHLCVNTTGIEIKAVVPAVAEYYRCWAGIERAGK